MSISPTLNFEHGIFNFGLSSYEKRLFLYQGWYSNYDVTLVVITSYTTCTLYHAFSQKVYYNRAASGQRSVVGGRWAVVGGQ